MKTKYAAILAGLLIIVLLSCGSGKKYEPTWESLTSHEIPQWLLDAKFGIYAHWGVYSVPAFETEWYGKRMYDMDSNVYAHHVAIWGDPAEFGYKDFVPMFKAEHYDPNEWADLIEQAGARYAGFAVVHHDGFCLWDSKFTRWNAKNMGPKRDLYGELVEALRKKENIKVIATFHHIRTFNWYLPYQGNYADPLNMEKKKRYADKKWDIFDPEYGDLYWNSEVGRKREDFIKEWNNKVVEVMDKYQPDVVWFDGGSFQDEESSLMVRTLLSHYYNQGEKWGKQVEVLNKLPTTMKFNFPENFGVLTFEEGRDRGPVVERPWIDDMKISDRAWCYIEGQTYKSANEIIDGLIDRVARGGGLLLNLSPKSDGTIPEAQQEILSEIGAWLKTNGEAIYGSRPWKVQAEGETEKFMQGGRHRKWVFRNNCDGRDIRFTQKDGRLFAILLGWPPDGVARIRSLASEKVSGIGMIGKEVEVKWQVKEDVLEFPMPAVDENEPAYVFEIFLK